MDGNYGCGDKLRWGPSPGYAVSQQAMSIHNEAASIEEPLPVDPEPNDGRIGIESRFLLGC
jgi:hypothetical protein